MRSFPDRVILVVDFFLSVLYIYPAIPFWPAEFLLKDQQLNIWGLSCMLLVLFSCCFNILYLCLMFVSLISMCLVACFSLGLSCMVLFALLGLIDYFLFHVGEISTIVSSKICSYPFFFSSSGTPII